MPILSTDVVNKDFSTKEYREWTKTIHLDRAIHHAKFWEQMMIHEALKSSNMLRPGTVGLGFGVGREQLVSAFAATGASIVATDQAPDDESIAWDNGQLANGKKSLYYPKIIDRKSFDINVVFQHHDMNTDEESFYNKFDFCWSNCVVGHLGSMEKSESFLARHAKYLKSGGISVLTTELNISSLTSTVSDNSGTIIWRLEDLYRVFDRMLDHNMVASRFKLRLSRDKTDSYIYYDIDFVDPRTINKIDSRIFLTKIPFSNYAITPVQIIFKKKTLSETEKRVRRAIYQLDFKRNTKKLRNFINSGGDIEDYATTYLSTDMPIVPNKALYKLSVKAGETKKASVRFTNNTKLPFFSYGLHTPLNVPPLVLATSSPVNRESSLSAPGWFSPNRPSVKFKPVFKESDFQDRCHGYHRALPGEEIEYTFDVKAPKKPGVYIEEFCLVLEGKGDIPASRVKIEITSKH